MKGLASQTFLKLAASSIARWSLLMCLLHFLVFMLPAGMLENGSHWQVKGMVLNGGYRDGAHLRMTTLVHVFSSSSGAGSAGLSGVVKPL